MRKTRIVVALAAAVAMATAGCSSSGGSTGSTGSTGSSGGAGNNAPIKVGVLTSLTGAAATGFTGVEAGVKARFAVENAKGGVNGHKLEYVMEDDASTAAGAKAATQKAIQQDKVFGLLSVSSNFYGAASIATSARLPVVGAGFDGGPEWIDKANTNLFDILGGQDYTKVSTTFGLVAKKLGVTKMTSVGYIESPSAAEAAKSSIASAQAAGIAAGPYQGVHYGSTDVGPTVLAIKNSGADGLYLPVIPTTAFAIVGGLLQAGVHMKMIVLATGYGADILASPQAVEAAQGVYFVSTAAPAELATAGTQAFISGLKQYAAFTGTIPSFSQYAGWLTADAFIQGLQGAGSNPTAATFVSNLRSATWQGGGLSQPVNFSQLGLIGGGMGPGNCLYLPQLQGTKFVLAPGLDPICGALIPGKTVSP